MRGRTHKCMGKETECEVRVEVGNEKKRQAIELVFLDVKIREKKRKEGKKSISGKISELG